MNIKVKWRITDGRAFVAITLPGGFTVSIPQYTAWQLCNELQRILKTPPPYQQGNPDNEQQ